MLNAYTMAINDIFLASIPFALLALATIFFLKEIPLRTADVPPAAQAAARDDAAEPEPQVPAFSGH